MILLFPYVRVSACSVSRRGLLHTGRHVVQIWVEQGILCTEAGASRERVRVRRGLVGRECGLDREYGLDRYGGTLEAGQANDVRRRRAEVHPLDPAPTRCARAVAGL